MNNMEHVRNGEKSTGQVNSADNVMKVELDRRYGAPATGLKLHNHLNNVRDDSMHSQWSY